MLFLIEVCTRHANVLSILSLTAIRFGSELTPIGKLKERWCQGVHSGYDGEFPYDLSSLDWGELRLLVKPSKPRSISCERYAGVGRPPPKEAHQGRRVRFLAERWVLPQIRVFWLRLWKPFSAG